MDDMDEQPWTSSHGQAAMDNMDNGRYGQAAMDNMDNMRIVHVVHGCLSMAVCPYRPLSIRPLEKNGCIKIARCVRIRVTLRIVCKLNKRCSDENIIEDTVSAGFVRNKISCL